MLTVSKVRQYITPTILKKKKKNSLEKIYAGLHNETYFQWKAYLILTESDFSELNEQRTDHCHNSFFFWGGGKGSNKFLWMLKGYNFLTTYFILLKIWYTELVHKFDIIGTDENLNEIGQLATTY